MKGMSMDAYNAQLLEPAKQPGHPALLVSALLHLMSQYTVNLHDSGSCVRMAAIIERHLQALADLPSLEPVLRATCLQLTEQWSGLVERSMPEPEKPTVMKRLIAAARL